MEPKGIRELFQAIKVPAEEDDLFSLVGIEKSVFNTMSRPQHAWDEPQSYVHNALGLGSLLGSFAIKFSEITNEVDHTLFSVFSANAQVTE